MQPRFHSKVESMDRSTGTLAPHSGPYVWLFSSCDCFPTTLDVGYGIWDMGYGIWDLELWIVDLDNLEAQAPIKPPGG
ncbi:uncharacterized protein EAF01_008033 [Botrytis porri]|uniref:uncharacterized protein n=1 Tax=Botrytis porri TaxID=87229 RepID=UPI001901A01C|nr:uncharacterized protein EAF01_008033 [Botrytis porri]KAF7900731.1 hypothetical protein EAF01_008033 [Botrytis porri]